jgi:WD40 repeat protein
MLTDSNSTSSTSSNTHKLNETSSFHSRRQLILKQRFCFGQCTAADWSHLSGATRIALGYTNGTVALYHVNSNSLAAAAAAAAQTTTANDKTDSLEVYPARTFIAHYNQIKCLRWCKLSSGVLASGCLFSREIRVWDVRAVGGREAVVENEAFVTDFDFSLHSNDLLVVKESLKGENRLFALDLSHGPFNLERDESRARSALFFTNFTHTAVHVSDLLNKLLVCDTDGSVIVSRAGDSRHWINKHKLINNSYAVCNYRS